MDGHKSRCHKRDVGDLETTRICQERGQRPTMCKQKQFTEIGEVIPKVDERLAAVDIRV